MVWKPIVFTVVFGSGSLIAAAIWQYENTRTRVQAAMSKPFSWLGDYIFGPEEDTSPPPSKYSWRGLSDGKKLFVPIVVINSTIYGAWKISKLEHIMSTYFCMNPASDAVCLPLVLSNFSHYYLIRLVTNMGMLFLICDPAVESLGKEQFIGLYINSGCVTSLFSYLYKDFLGHTEITLGASGGVMTIIGHLCTVNPDKVVIDCKYFNIRCDIILKVVMVFDAVALVFKLHLYDHAAHLAGALLGIFWGKFGDYYIWKAVEVVEGLLLMGEQVGII